MDIFMKVLGGLFSLAMAYFGFYFLIRPSKAVQSLQRMKYKETGEPRKTEKIFSMIFGAVLALIGLFLLTIVVLAFVYPS